MKRRTIISSDAHVVEPPDLWTSRVPARYRDRAPAVVQQGNAECWYADGIMLMSHVGGANTGLRFESNEKLRHDVTFNDVRPGGYIPAEQVREMDLDGVDVNIIYPSTGLLVYAIADTELLSVTARVYNQWLAEFCSAFPDRLKGIAVVNVDHVSLAVEQLEEARKLGLVGVMIPCFPPHSLPYNHPMYDPFWAAAQDLDMPISLHVATNRFQPVQGFASPATESVLWSYMGLSVANVVLGGVFERFPRLKVVSAEHEAAWALHLIQSMDFFYSQFYRNPAWPRFKSGVMPSDFFRRNVKISFQEDPIGVRMRETIGIDMLMWGSDYPHAEGTFPKTQEILDRMLAGVPEEHQDKVVRGNAAAAYGVKLEPAPARR